MALKAGEAPYEDEKFAYLAVAREACSPVHARVLRHPMVHTGHVNMEICAREGLEAATVSRRDGPLYKRARDIKAGDGIRESLRDGADPETF
jgi:ribosomal protein RSM22 (predicted rRNA methylase)